MSGYLFQDYGMDEYYRIEDRKQLNDDAAESNYLCHKNQCLKIANQIAEEYLSNCKDAGVEPDEKSWRELLADEAAWVSQEVSEAMIYAIRYNEDFTLESFIEEKKAWLTTLLSKKLRNTEQLNGEYSEQLRENSTSRQGNLKNQSLSKLGVREVIKTLCVCLITFIKSLFRHKENPTY